MEQECLKSVTERRQRNVWCTQFNRKTVPHPRSLDSEAAVAVVCSGAWNSQSAKVSGSKHEILTGGRPPRRIILWTGVVVHCRKWCGWRQTEKSGLSGSRGPWVKKKRRMSTHQNTVSISTFHSITVRGLFSPIGRDHHSTSGCTGHPHKEFS